MESKAKAIELNTACGHQREEEVYEHPLHLNSASKDSAIIDERNKKKILSITAIAFAGIALVLAILALLVAIVAIYLGTHGTQLANSSSQENLQNTPTLKQMVQTLQVELNRSKNEIIILQDRVSSQDKF